MSSFYFHPDDDELVTELANDFPRPFSEGEDLTEYDIRIVEEDLKLMPILISCTEIPVNIVDIIYEYLCNIITVITNFSECRLTIKLPGCFTIIIIQNQYLEIGGVCLSFISPKIMKYSYFSRDLDREEPYINDFLNTYMNCYWPGDNIHFDMKTRFPCIQNAEEFRLHVNWELYGYRPLILTPVNHVLIRQMAHIAWLFVKILVV